MHIFLKSRHIPPSYLVNPDEREVFYSGIFKNYHAEEISGKCYVMHISDYVQGKPISVSESHTFFARYFYDNQKPKVLLELNWQSFHPPDWKVEELEAHPPNFKLPAVSENEDLEEERFYKSVDKRSFKCSYDPNCQSKFTRPEELYLHFKDHLLSTPFTNQLTAMKATPFYNRAASYNRTPYNHANARAIIMNTSNNRSSEYPLVFRKENEQMKLLDEDLVEHFENANGQILWFSAPPVNIPREKFNIHTNDPLHSLDYLLFKANKHEMPMPPPIKQKKAKTVNLESKIDYNKVIPLIQELNTLLK
jgi:hypothetical protein